MTTMDYQSSKNKLSNIRSQDPIRVYLTALTILFELQIHLMFLFHDYICTFFYNLYF